MKLWYRIILLTFIIFIAGIFYWALNAPKPEISERIYQTLKEQEKQADLTFKDVTFEEVVAGVKYWELSANNAMVNKSTSLATLKEATGTFFKKGKSTLRFRSPAALWDMKKKEILLDNPIGYDAILEPKIAALLDKQKKSRFSVFNLPASHTVGPGYWFRANNLSWKLTDQKLLCTGGIKLNKGEVTGYSERLEGDVGLERAILAGNPRLVVAPQNTSHITLEAKAFEIISAEDVIIARGNPRINWEEAQVLANEVKYLQKKGILSLSGAVQINYKDIQATGDAASYFTELGRIDLEGNAHAQQGENELSGEKVRVSLKDQKISVLGKGRVIITEED